MNYSIVVLRLLLSCAVVPAAVWSQLSGKSPLDAKILIDTNGSGNDYSSFSTSDYDPSYSGVVTGLGSINPDVVYVYGKSNGGWGHIPVTPNVGVGNRPYASRVWGYGPNSGTMLDYSRGKPPYTIPGWETGSSVIANSAWGVGQMWQPERFESGLTYKYTLPVWSHGGLSWSYKDPEPSPAAGLGGNGLNLNYGEYGITAREVVPIDLDEEFRRTFNSRIQGAHEDMWKWSIRDPEPFGVDPFGNDFENLLRQIRSSFFLPFAFAPEVGDPGSGSGNSDRDAEKTLEEGNSGDVDEITKQPTQRFLAQLNPVSSEVRKRYEAYQLQLLEYGAKKLERAIAAFEELDGLEEEVSVQGESTQLERLSTKYQEKLIEHENSKLDYNIALYNKKKGNIDVELTDQNSAFYGQSAFGWVSLVVVHLLFVIGIGVAVAETVKGWGAPPADASHEVMLGFEKVALKSKSLSVILLGLTFAFYVLYLKFVYPITVL
ncbi:hypothetical protein [Pelagicoccus sp. SDUM812005]|uniref:hypothetical protein n=1 Tax=Pelagicoccus sp. SDUM812005 TaxID=3041257 RepID=UPI00280F7D0A|nr:hypothetical protein [Pelagicoccus sp. SDUM812005]MDQ8182590.1 hypothetical protein [Pelagicoccus sp. SDUM812005]